MCPSRGKPGPKTMHAIDLIGACLNCHSIIYFLEFFYYSPTLASLDTVITVQYDTSSGTHTEDLYCKSFSL